MLDGFCAGVAVRAAAANDNEDGVAAGTEEEDIAAFAAASAMYAFTSMANRFFSSATRALDAVAVSCTPREALQAASRAAMSVVVEVFVPVVVANDDAAAAAAEEEDVAIGVVNAATLWTVVGGVLGARLLGAMIAEAALEVGCCCSASAGAPSSSIIITVPSAALLFGCCCC
jgi:hypothetical protein